MMWSVQWTLSRRFISPSSWCLQIMWVSELIPVECLHFTEAHRSAHMTPHGFHFARRFPPRPKKQQQQRLSITHCPQRLWSEPLWIHFFSLIKLIPPHGTFERAVSSSDSAFCRNCSRAAPCRRIFMVDASVGFFLICFVIGSRLSSE